ncbi:MAG: serine/threonine-protein kinase [Calothrix sp. MO_167.B42]|nr:serine/threonine-protein kinase [Calothrix sp. MO_167.B42]
MSQSPLLKPEIPSGTLIDNRYLIQELLGQGGLGRTYLAFDTRRFHEPCVLKEFAPIGTGKSELEKCRNLFIREAKILYQLTHPQIPRFLACFEGDGRLFLVQEFVDGKTYSSILGERQATGQSFSESEAIQWLKNILPILHYVHQHNIIHRDISPDNIMLPKGKNLPVLIDFGVGKQIADIQEVGTANQANFTFVGKMSLVGKVGYAPREQISLGVCSPSSDIYALGVTTIVLLTGKDPSLLMDQYTLEWKWHLYVKVSPSFATIIDKMLADIPRNRYQTSHEVITDLDSLTATPIVSTDIENQEISPTRVTIFDTVEESSTNTTEIESTPETQAYVDSFEAEKSSEFPATSFDNWQELPITAVSNEDSVEVEPQLPPKLETIETSVDLFFADSEPISTQPPSSNVQKSSETVFSSPTTSENYQSTSSYQNQYNTSVDPFFIKRCQEELAYYIGPMASMIVEDTLIDHPQASAYQLVEILAREIPESQSALEFTRKLLR